MANKKRVLLVEDDESVRRMVRVSLEMNEYDVIEAKDGLEGLLLLEMEKPDAVVLDLMMPDVSGGRMYDEMRKHRATAGIPIVVVTGKPDAHEIFDEEIGSDNVVMKPFEADSLLERIRHHIGEPE